MPSKLFELARGEMAWGDYGAILAHGMDGHLGRDSRGRLRLQRTGPFVPPITLPGSAGIVVTDEVRKKLEASDLTGMRFRKVTLAHVVILAWEEWDRTSPPPRLPPGGEPEHYFVRGKHSPELARRIGPLWEVYARSKVALVADGVELLMGLEFPRFVPDRDSWSGDEYCAADRGPGVFVTGKARRVVERLSKGYVVGVEMPWASRGEGREKI